MTHAMIFMRELNEKNDKHFHKRYDKKRKRAPILSSVY